MLSVVFLLASVFSLICISCDRIIKIIKPFRKENGTEVTYAVVITIWVTALIIAFPLSFWKTYRTRQWCDYLEVNLKFKSLQKQDTQKVMCYKITLHNKQIFKIQRCKLDKMTAEAVNWKTYWHSRLTLNLQLKADHKLIWIGSTNC